MDHIWHKCHNEYCQICEGGLGWCVICNAFEGQLLTCCPGYKLNENALQECYHGKVKDICHFRTMVSLGAHIINGELVWNQR
jgi:hypothetical protein